MQKTKLFYLKKLSKKFGSGKPKTGYNWYLTNDEDLKFDGLEPSNLNEYKRANYVKASLPKGKVGDGGTFDFKLKLSNNKKMFLLLNSFINDLVTKIMEFILLKLSCN